MAVELHDGVAVLRRDRFRLQVIHTQYEDATLEAHSESFDALIDLRSQLIALGYRMERLDSVGPIRNRE